MSSQIKPIQLWGKGGANPPKVAILLKELDIPHEIVPISFPDLKKPDFLAINPNGRMPAIQDPNTDITVWETGAIFEYLIEKYNTKHQLSFAAGTPESYHAKQWLYFQTSGQGPYYGQAVWFKKYHPEQVPSAIERYVKEINRVTGVLENHLAKQKEAFSVSDGGDGPWLVGNKLSFADLAFVTWQSMSRMGLVKDQYDVDNFPHVKEWLGKMTSRGEVKAVIESAMPAKKED